ncbi:MAG: hypothetical protein KKE17_11950 [Proteobacteria bacterium]|nr:hypothetical protein [Pseudomonadota bacterium]MBU1710709.1 hypothetical protein [Pseudomonadota bacterium]
METKLLRFERKMVEAFDNMMVAATFAEAGEWDTARTMIPAAKVSAKVNVWDQLFTAITFAEGGLFDEARQIITGMEKCVSRKPLDLVALEQLGLRKIHLVYGTMSVEC